MPKTKEQIAAYNKEYFARPDVVARAKVRNAQYRQRRADYKKTDAGKEAEKRYRKTENSLRYQHEYRLKAVYGINEAEYQRLYQEQGGLCAICSKSVEGRLHIDHDHATGRIRGLLCNSCNMALGLLKDNTELLRKAQDYLNAV